MKENIIYVAGNPDAYPVEYYDKETNTYKGVLPEMYRQFSEESSYEIRYYNPTKIDKRHSLAEQKQVDFISGCVSAQEFPHLSGMEIPVFVTRKEGLEETYFVLPTEIAPSGFTEALSAFFDKKDHAEETGLLIQCTTEYAQFVQRGNQNEMLGLGILVLFLIGFIIFLAKKHRRQIQKVEEMKETDLETGIGNEEYLRRNYRSMINDRNRVLYGVFYFHLDVDRLERVTSKEEKTLFLKHMANILQEYSADYDILARVSDGGFVLVHQVINQSEMEQWLEPILERIRSFSSKKGVENASRVTAGIYLLKIDDKNLDESILNAEQSAMLAYSLGEPYKICTNEIMKRFMEERKLQGQIIKGLENKEFLLYIQFYVEASTQRIVGGEALSRWNHPQMGFLSPSRFVPLMEHEGLVDELDYYCLERVCVFLEQLKKIGIKDFFISCNFSRETFSSEQFIDRCKAIIEQYDFNHKLLIFEITESIMVRDEEVAYQNIQAVKELGISLALDDVGDGFSSLLDIQQYPLDGIKLDKCLVDNVGKVTGDIIIQAMIEVGHKIGIPVLAEGVENQEQADKLVTMGCDVIQGFLFHYPIPEWEALRKLLEIHKVQ